MRTKRWGTTGVEIRRKTLTAPSIPCRPTEAKRADTEPLTFRPQESNPSPLVAVGKDSAPGGIRTHNTRILSPLPLPVGLQAQMRRRGKNERKNLPSQRNMFRIRKKETSISKHIRADDGSRTRVFCLEGRSTNRCATSAFDATLAGFNRRQVEGNLLTYHRSHLPGERTLAMCTPLR